MERRVGERGEEKRREEKRERIVKGSSGHSLRRADLVAVNTEEPVEVDRVEEAELEPELFA